MAEIGPGQKSECAFQNGVFETRPSKPEVRKERMVKTRFVCTVMLLGCLAGASRSALAQSRPLATEDPETVPAGHMLIEGGLDYGYDITFPASGLKGNLWRIGTYGLSIGVSSIAEIQFDGGFKNRLVITSFDPTAPLAEMLDIDGDTTSEVEDLTVGTKIRFLSESPSRPAMAFKMATKLPMASNETGLGLDTTDFHFALFIGKTIESVRVVGNIGFGILSDPIRGDQQNDVLEYGFSVARAVVPDVEVVAELSGRQHISGLEPPIGTESRSVARIGSRFTRGPVRVDAAFAIGITENDPTWGFTVGLTWVFRAFTRPSACSW
jgi:hypothetical protein